MSTYRLYVLKTLEDHKDADSFLTLAEQRLKTIKSHKFTWWDPSLLLPGDDREAEINKYLSEASYVIPLLSPSLLAATKDEKDREVPILPRFRTSFSPSCWSMYRSMARWSASGLTLARSTAETSPSLAPTTALTAPTSATVSSTAS